MNNIVFNFLDCKYIAFYPSKKAKTHFFSQIKKPQSILFCECKYRTYFLLFSNLYYFILIGMFHSPV